MASKALGVNGKILEWARERAGLTIEDVAAKFKKDPAVIEAWESGEDAPTYVQLEKLSYKLYDRPVALFFFPEPPEEVEPKGEFRLIPDQEIERLSPGMRRVVRRALASQESLRELTGGRNPADARIVDRVDARRLRSLDTLAKRVREGLGVNLVTQMSWDSLDTAFKRWRAAIEGAGVFVFKNAFGDDDVSGFCLYDEVLPLIYLNNSTSQARQIFTLFHELAHLLYHASGITLQDESYLDRLKGRDLTIETMCNRFAGAFLVPDADFDVRSARMRGEDVEVEELARLYNVSREVILRKFRDRRLVSQSHYEEKRRAWNEEWRRRREESEGGDYYRTQATYLSETYTRLAFNRYYDGGLSVEQLGDYLGMKAKNVSTFETYLTAM